MATGVDTRKERHELKKPGQTYDDLLPGDDVREFLDVADEKTERVCKETLGDLAEGPYPGRGRGEKGRLPIDGRGDRYRMYISRTYRRISKPSSPFGSPYSTSTPSTRAFGLPV